MKRKTEVVLNEKYIVRGDNHEIICSLNERLIKSKNISDESLELIKKLHLEKHYVMLNMDEDISKNMLQIYAREITEIEYSLQEAWGFPRDAKFHRFWELPNCQCPKLDNEERYGTDYYITSSNCPIHG